MAVRAHPDDESLGFGGTLAHYACRAAETRKRARRELEALFNNQNTSGRLDTTPIPATCLRVTVSV